MHDLRQRLIRAFAGARESDTPLRAIDRWGISASAGVAAVLLLSTLFAFDAAGRTDAAAARAQAASALDGRMRTALASLAREQMLEREYRLRPTSAAAVAQRAGAGSFEGEVREIGRRGDANDRRFAGAALQLQGAYKASTAGMFVAGREARAGAGPDGAAVAGTFGALQRRVGARAAEQERRAAQTFADLRTSQKRAVGAISLLSLLGVACLAVMFFIFGTYRRRIVAAHALELHQLEEAALTDNLTKLGNHRAYQEDLHREISRAKRHGDELTLALLDVDDLKLLNDQSGHIHGDRVLIALGALLGSLRHEDRAYRIGGDEFSVLFPQTSNAHARETLERLRLRAQEKLLGGTISGGIATLSPDCDAETLHAQADAALYAAKRGGRNALTVYDAGAPGQSVVSRAKVAGLRALIEEKGLSIVFQPIWDVRRGAVLAYEALARPAPRFGFGGPQEAFNLAERVGRAQELDAVSRQATLERAATLPPDALLFINMSPQSLAGRRLDVARFEAEVRAAGLTPERIVIEVTERSIKHLPAVVLVGQELKSAGFRLALDDVGSGNAGLEILTELHIDFVKIDRGVIAKAALDTRARGVLAGIIVIAKSTGAYVIAEGIESIEMLNLICSEAIDWRAMEHGIEGAQGYLLHRPREEFLTAGEVSEVGALVAGSLALHATSPPGMLPLAPSLLAS